MNPVRNIKKTNEKIISYYPIFNGVNLTSKRIIKNLRRKHLVRPEKRLGQNFLINKKVLWKIIKTADLKPEDIVLEIGPGIGNLTLELAKSVKRVITIEKDQKMITILKETLKDFDNVQIVKADILKINLKSKILNPCPIPKRSFWYRVKSYKVVANLPFYLTAPVIRKFLELVDIESRPMEMILVVQKEVAQRICVKPPDMNLLAVSVQFYAKPEIISFVSKKSFWPQPKVDSAIIRIVPNSTNYTMVENVLFRKRFFKVVRAGFSQPRKYLSNNLAKMLKLDKEKIKNWLLKNKIKPTQRAETLSLQNWLSLTKSFTLTPTHWW